MTNAQQPVEDGNDGLVRIARQIVLMCFIQHPALVTTTSKGFHTIEPKQICANFSSVTAANGIHR